MVATLLEDSSGMLQYLIHPAIFQQSSIMFSKTPARHIKLSHIIGNKDISSQHGRRQVVVASASPTANIISQRSIGAPPPPRGGGGGGGEDYPWGRGSRFLVVLATPQMEPAYLRTVTRNEMLSTPR